MTTSPSQPGLSVLIVDGHPLMSSALESALVAAGMNVVGRLTSVAPMRPAWLRDRPDVVVCAATLVRPLDGIDAVAALTKEIPEARVLIYSAHTDREALLAADSAGVAGYVRTTATVADLVRAIEEVGAGRGGYDPATATDMIKALRGNRKQPAALTTREREVLLALCAGTTSTASLAAALHMGDATVKSHLAAIESKLGVHDRAGILSSAYRLGLVPDRRNN